MGKIETGSRVSAIAEAMNNTGLRRAVMASVLSAVIGCAQAEPTTDSEVVGGVEIPHAFLTDTGVSEALTAYKTQLEAEGVDVNQTQECDKTDPEYDTLWESCMEMYGAVANARVALKEGFLESSQEAITQRNTVLEDSQNAVESRQDDISTKDEKIDNLEESADEKDIRIAALESLLAIAEEL